MYVCVCPSYIDIQFAGDIRITSPTSEDTSALSLHPHLEGCEVPQRPTALARS